MVDSLKYQRDEPCQLRKCLQPECHSATLCPVVGWYLVFVFPVATTAQIFLGRMGPAAGVVEWWMVGWEKN